jgi:hypothetical protein
MQLIPRYLVNNRTTVVVNDAGFATEFRPVYTKELNIYRGIENNLEFKIVNADQKGKSLTNYTVRFVAFDEDGDQVLNKIGTASSTVTGLLTVTISESDIIDLKDQFLTYTVYLEDDNGNRTLTYSHSNLSNNGYAKISSDAFPGAKESKSISTFTQTIGNAQEWTTAAMDAQPGKNGNSALHTIAVYSSNFTGDVEVQASLSNTSSVSMPWTTVATVSLANETMPVDANFNGVYQYIRFRTTTDPANISKILVRN